MIASTLLPLLQNAALLLAMVLIYDTVGQIMVQRGQLSNIITGLVMGFIAVALMLTPFHFVSGIIFDTRSVLISLVGLFFGPIPTLVTMLVAALFRFIQGGLAAWVGIGVIAVSGGAGLLWRQLRASPLSTVTWGELYGLGLVVHLLMLLMMLTLPQPTAFDVLRTISLPVMLIYPAATVALGALMVNRLKQDDTAATLSENEERLRLALSAANLALADIDLKTGRFIINDTYAEYLELPPNSFEETLDSAINRIHPRDRHRVFNAFRDYGTQKKGAHADELYQEFRVQVSPGKSIWVASLSKLVDWDEAGWPVRMLTTVTDITPRKDAEQILEQAHRETQQLLEESTQARLSLTRALEDHQKAERALRESEQSLAEVSRIARVGGWELDPRSRRIHLTPQSYSNLELNPMTRPSLEDIVNLATGADRKRIKAAFMATLSAGTSFDLEVKLATGEAQKTTWVRFIGQSVPGGPRGSMIKGTVQDITERKEIQEALELASLVYQNTSEGMLVTDAETRIIDVNKAFTETTGYSREEIIGKTPGILQSGKHSKRFYQSMWQELNAKGHWEGELWNKRKNGESYPEWLVINAVRHPDGEIYRWVAQFTDITEQKKNEKLIWQQANFDALTNLPNRRMFFDRLDQEIKKTHRSGLSLALLFIDLDHFKEINDTLGHETGDLLLKEAATRIDSCIRETDTVARLGGDEFIIMLTELRDNATLEPVIRSILDRLSEPYKLGNEMVFVTASMGVTICPDDAGDPDTLMKNADQAMYAAKHEGRDGYQFFTPHMQQKAQKRMRIISDLRVALASDQLWVAYQPIIELATGRISKAEALLRWNHPKDGHIGPDTFIGIAEETGLIHPLSDFLFDEVSREASELIASHDPDFQISINISPAQLQRREKSVYENLYQHINQRGLPGGALALEITEGLLLDRRPAVADQLIAFRDAGIQVALDDFGTGYSSLSYLKKFDIDYLKIDKSFINNLTAGSEDLVLCEAIIVMAHKLGIEVVAEGVETEEQRDLLLAAGCDYAQGYLYSRPVDSQSLQVFLEQSRAKTGTTDS